MFRSEIDGLIKDLVRCSNPANCPHGRPILLKLTKKIPKRFLGEGDFDFCNSWSNIIWQK